MNNSGQSIIRYDRPRGSIDAFTGSMRTRCSCGGSHQKRTRTRRDLRRRNPGPLGKELRSLSHCRHGRALPESVRFQSFTALTTRHRFETLFWEKFWVFGNLVSFLFVLYHLTYSSLSNTVHFQNSHFKIAPFLSFWAAFWIALFLREL